MCKKAEYSTLIIFFVVYHNSVEKSNNSLQEEMFFLRKKRNGGNSGAPDGSGHAVYIKGRRVRGDTPGGYQRYGRGGGALQFIAKADLRNGGYHRAGLMAHLLKGGQGGESGKQGLLLCRGRAGIREQGAADGCDCAVIQRERDGAVKHRHVTPQAQGSNRATAGLDRKSVV